MIDQSIGIKDESFFGNRELNDVSGNFNEGHTKISDVSGEFGE